ncbi:MAG: bacteriophage holin [Nitrospirota bacterium]
MRFKPVALGVSLGIVWGGVLFITTWISYFTGYGTLFLQVMGGSIYPGYSISPAGSIIGLLYGFIDMLVFGALFGWIYNKVARV